MRILDELHQRMVMDEDEEEQYNRYWRGYKERMALIFNSVGVPAIVTIGLLTIAFCFFLYVIGYPEPINISLFGIP